MVNTFATSLGSLALALLVTACDTPYELGLRVDNQSATNATIDIVAGSEHEPAAEPLRHFSEVVAAGSEVEWPLELPGPGDWTIFVNGRTATDSDAWPRDNPTLDFTITIKEDGSVSVDDT